MFQVFQYFGCDDGWQPVTDYVDQTTAARRLRLRRACRGHLHIYAIRRKHSSHNLDLSDCPSPLLRNEVLLCLPFFLLLSHWAWCLGE